MALLKELRARRTTRRTVSIVGMAALVAGLLTIGAPSVGAASCVAKDGVQQSSDLQSIIDFAGTGDTIVIKGTCMGNYQVPGGGSATSLTLKGKGGPTLDGNAAGSVVTITTDGMAVTFIGLSITNGHSALDGGGINTPGTFTGSVTVKNTSVNGNVADRYGGGIEINTGTVVVSGSSQVNGNTATYSGGIDVFSGGHVTITGNAQENGNHATTESGATDNYGGIMSVTGHAEVRFNTSDGRGGAITNYNGGTLTLSKYARVDNNTAASTGGGIQNGDPSESGCTLSMKNYAEVEFNTAGTDGGGIYNDPGDSCTNTGAVAGTNVAYNNPNDIAP